MDPESRNDPSVRGMAILSESWPIASVSETNSEPLPSAREKGRVHFSVHHVERHRTSNQCVNFFVFFVVPYTMQIFQVFEQHFHIDDQLPGLRGHAAQFLRDVPAVVAEAYANTYDRCGTGLPAFRGMSQYCKICEGLVALTKQYYGGNHVLVKNQLRLAFTEDNGFQTQIAVRHGVPTSTGFLTGRIGSATRDFSLFESTMEFEPGILPSVGALILHHVPKQFPEYVQVYLVTSWRTDSSFHIVCNKAYNLGMVRFRSTERLELPFVGETPNL